MSIGTRCDNGEHEYIVAETETLYEAPGVIQVDQLAYRIAGTRVTKLVCRICGQLKKLNHEVKA